MSYLTIFFDQMSYSAKRRIDQKSYATNCRIGEMVFYELSCTHLSHLVPMQCSPFIMLSFGSKGKDQAILQRHYMKMTISWSFFYNSFVKFYAIIPPQNTELGIILMHVPGHEKHVYLIHERQSCFSPVRSQLAIIG